MELKCSCGGKLRPTHDKDTFVCGLCFEEWKVVLKPTLVKKSVIERERLRAITGKA